MISIQLLFAVNILYQDEVEVNIHQYSLSLRRISVLIIYTGEYQSNEKNTKLRTNLLTTSKKSNGKYARSTYIHCAMKSVRGKLYIHLGPVVRRVDSAQYPMDKSYPVNKYIG
jgi:hypothetical protein